MAHAVTRDGTTTIYGPGDAIAGAFVHAEAIDDDPVSRAESAEDDAQLRDGWVRTLAQHEEAMLAAHAAGDAGTVDRIRAAVERSAYAQVQLATLDGLVDDVLTAAGIAPSERTRATLRTLLLGGRNERTWRRWRSGEQLVPAEAADYLSRLRGVEIVERDEPEGRGRRLQLELVID